MNTITLELDISKQGTGDCVRVGQGDASGTTIRALIYDNGQEVTLSGATVWLVVLQPDKRHYYRGQCTVSGNAATCVIDESKLCSVSGFTDEAYFTVTKGGATYSTNRFAIDILRSALDGQKPAQNWDAAVDDLIARGNAAVNSANTAASNANSAASKANSAATAANNAATAANNAASAANTAKQNADKATTAANNAASAANTAKQNADAATAAANQAAQNANTAAQNANTAASNANAVTTAEEYDRQQSINQYGGRSIESVFANEIGSNNVWTWLQSRVKAANFAGLRIGDYIDVQLTAGANVPLQTVRYRIGAIDHYYQCGDTAKGHHIVMVPNAPVSVTGSKASNSSCLQWRDTNDNNGTSAEKHPYLVSKLHNWEINDFLPSLPSALQNAIMVQRVLLEERYSSSEKLTESSGWSWADLGKIWSPSEMEVYGCPVWGTKGYSVGFDSQFPIFNDTASRLNGNRVNWWLRSVMGGSASDACRANDYGSANGGAPTGGWVRPRPCFLIG
ncbi:MAG: phage baseplate upper protein [Coriobacteriaceae bacterium]|nr:phage baseplate upper protein [Coriobacteriaceae bacterium]